MPTLRTESPCPRTSHAGHHIRKAVCSAVGTANARLNQLWLDALAAERGPAASTLHTYRDDLATAALRLKPAPWYAQKSAKSDPKPTLDRCHQHCGAGASP